MQVASFRRGLIAAALLAASCASAENLSENEGPNSTEAERTQQQQAPQEMWVSPYAGHAEGPAIIPRNDPTKASNYEYGCDAPKSREDADSCQSRRSADATVQQAELAIKQYIVGIIGLGATILAAGATAYAAWAAKLAADAAAGAAKEAAASNKIAQDIGNTQLRAYISIESACVNNFAQGQRQISECKIKNFGQTPAYQYNAVISGIFALERYARHVIDYYIYFIERSIDTANKNNFILGPGGEIFSRVKDATPISDAEWEGLNRGDFYVYVFGRVQYVDAFGEARFMTYFMNGDRQHTHSEEPICQMHLYERGNNAN